MRKWFGMVAVGVMLFLGSASAHAQDAGKLSFFAGYSYMLNSWGNACVAACAGGASTGLHGYTGSVAYNFTRNIGLEANFSGHNGTSTVDNEPPVGTSNGFQEVERQDLYSYTFGPRVTLPAGQFSLFAHFLVGGASGHEGFTDACLQAVGGSECGSADMTSSHGGGFAMKLGGGADWNHGRWGVRILEVDYLHASTFVHETGNDFNPDSFGITANNLELSTGVTLNIK